MLKYILAVYSCQQDLEKYERRVEKLRNSTRRNHADELLKSLRRSLENADGIGKIFARHMPNRHGKYIVFCSDAAHMNRMIDLVPGWFAQLDDAPRIYRAYSTDPTARAVFTAFREDESNHLKLLFTIDTLNEGIADVDGVILFRPIEYALPTEISKTPVIFDIVNNIENLRSVDAFEQEFEEAVLRISDNEREQQELRQRFQIIDETRGCRELFERLHNTLTYTWEDMYERAKAYYEEHGDLKIPKTYYTEEGYALGTWILTQRAIRKGIQHGTLGEERITKLDEIGMLWTVREGDRWPEYYKAAEAYAHEFGNLCVPDSYVTPDGVKLGQWLSNLKAKYKRGGKGRYMTKERIAALDEIGMVWDADQFQWEQKYRAAQRYYQEFRNLEVPVRYVTPDGINLGLWIQAARRDYKLGRLDEISIQRLEAIGMVWDIKQMRWKQRYQAAAEYYWEYGDLDIPVQYETPEGFKLGAWIQQMRKKYKQKTLTAAQVSLLESIGMIWDGIAEQRKRNYQAAKEYYQEYGNLKIPTNYVDDNGFHLGWWVISVRRAYQKGTLDKEQIERMEDIGMIWGTSPHNGQPNREIQSQP